MHVTSAHVPAYFHVQTVCSRVFPIVLIPQGALSVGDASFLSSSKGQSLFHRFTTLKFGSYVNTTFFRLQEFFSAILSCRPLPAQLLHIIVDPGLIRFANHRYYHVSHLKPCLPSGNDLLRSPFYRHQQTVFRPVCFFDLYSVQRKPFLPQIPSVSPAADRIPFLSLPFQKPVQQALINRLGAQEGCRYISCDRHDSKRQHLA